MAMMNFDWRFRRNQRRAWRTRAGTTRWLMVILGSVVLGTGGCAMEQQDDRLNTTSSSLTLGPTFPFEDVNNNGSFDPAEGDHDIRKQLQPKKPFETHNSVVFPKAIGTFKRTGGFRVVAGRNIVVASDINAKYLDLQAGESVVLEDSVRIFSRNIAFSSDGRIELRDNVYLSGPNLETNPPGTETWLSALEKMTIGNNVQIHKGGDTKILGKNVVIGDNFQALQDGKETELLIKATPGGSVPGEGLVIGSGAYIKASRYVGMITIDMNFWNCDKSNRNESYRLSLGPGSVLDTEPGSSVVFATHTCSPQVYVDVRDSTFIDTIDLRVEGQNIIFQNNVVLLPEVMWGGVCSHSFYALPGTADLTNTSFSRGGVSLYRNSIDSNDAQGWISAQVSAGNPRFGCVINVAAKAIHSSIDIPVDRW